MSEFSERLTDLRENKGWSKTYVAKTIGLSSMQTYANWEYGRTEPDFETTKKLANLFNVSTDYLLGRETSDKSDIDLDKAIDESRSFDGKPISDHDREVVKKILRGYFN